MDVSYFNFSSKYAAGRWDRSNFVRNWWRMYINDPRWVPPYYPAFRRSLEPDHNPHLNRLEPTFLSIEAMPHRQARRSDRRSRELDLIPFGQAAFEQTVATTLLLKDHRHRDRTAYLALLHCANDAESLERLLDAAAFHLAEEGFNRLVTISSLSPYLGSGFLQDSWDQIPPLGTPYDPPYLLELIETQLDPGIVTCLYSFDIPFILPANLPAHRPALPANIEISSFDPLRLADDLHTLFLGGLTHQGDFPAPDSLEAHFLLKWVMNWPVEARLASLDGKGVGFILLGPDLAPVLHRAKGGRSLVSRLWLNWAARQPVRQGRLYFGGVLPEERRKGVGKQLLQQALSFALDHSWEKLVIGPVLADSSAARYLERAGALRRATYRNYSLEL